MARTDAAASRQAIPDWSETEHQCDTSRSGPRPDHRLGGGMQEDKLSESLLGMIGSSEAATVLIELGETALDAMLREGVLRDIPILGSFISVVKAGGQIRDRLFVRKLAGFLAELARVEPEERRRFIEKLGEDSKERQRVGQAVMLLLDRMDDIEKAPLLAKAFAAFVAGQIGFPDFRRLATALDRCLLPDLEVMATRADPSEYSSTVAQGLSLCGLLEVGTVPGIRAPGVDNTYVATELGKLFRQIILGITSYPS